MKFIRDAEGNYSLNGFYIGTSIEDGESFYQHLYDDGDLNLIQIIDEVMYNVNCALEHSFKTEEDESPSDEKLTVALETLGEVYKYEKKKTGAGDFAYFGDNQTGEVAIYFPRKGKEVVDKLQTEFSRAEFFYNDDI